MMTATRSNPSMTPVVILDPFDVVLSQIISSLDLDEDQLLFPGVEDPMGSPHRDVHRSTGPKGDITPIEGHHRFSLDHIPVLLPVVVPLEAEAPLGKYHDPLHLIAGKLRKDLIIPPWPVILFPYRSSQDPLLPF